MRSISASSISNASIRQIPFRSLLLAGVLLLPVQNAQAGFFEALFGLEEAAPPVYVSPSPHSHSVRSHHAKKKKARIAKSPPRPVIIQALTGDAKADLLKDVTLRSGDAVMLPEGLRIFTGDSSGPHSLDDFQPIAMLSGRKARHKELLVAIAAAKANPIFPARREASLSVNTGRSAALSGEEPIPASLENSSRPSVRYVGP